MPTVHSHYENLKVPRDASPAAIRAAYRALTRKYHPDRNPGSTEAERIMAVVNVAYGVLTNPITRAEHDLWIAQSEEDDASPRMRRAVRLRTAPSHEPAYSVNEAAYHPPPPPELVARRRRRRAVQAAVVSHMTRRWIYYAVAATVLCALAIHRFVLTPSLPVVPYDRMAATGADLEARPPTLAYTRPLKAPNGQPWPEGSAYLGGYAVQNAKGLSDVKVDNSRNDADMLCKLYALDGPQPQAVRVFLVRAHARFTLSKLTAGTYDLRYRNLSDGRLARTQFFTLEEVPTANGTRVSSVPLTLYDAPNGNLQTYGLGEAEF